MRPFLTSLALLLLLRADAPAADAPLVVHEWGTFTSLQDETGRAIGGLNTDDEPVPEFVHSINSRLLLLPTQLPANYFVKGFPRLHPDVTMRLETPVMYFYPPAGAAPQTIDVRASFKGGWLTEYYPRAEAETPGLWIEDENGRQVLGGIDDASVGSLAWQGLRVGVDAEGPHTEEEVWLAPRRVSAAQVATPVGESEKYLFYRGVGCVDALLKVERRDSELLLRLQPDQPARTPIRSAWLADIRADGQSAFRALGALPTDRDPAEILARLPARFAASEFSADHLTRLRAEMRRALIDEGLFADEAEAMLDTWDTAYFRSPGLRLFYTVPPEWTDHYLPLDFSVPVELTRVMIGRIEIVTPQQRSLLAQIAERPIELFPRETVQEAFEQDGKNWNSNPTFQALLKGDMPLADLGVELPASFEDYLALGRLRNALVLDEYARHPTEHLQHFITNYGLDGHEIPGRAALAPAAISPTAVSESRAAALPEDLALEQNHPNPFNSDTVFRFALPEADEIELAVFNLTGQRVATLATGWRTAGTYAIHWNGRDDREGALASGVYLYRLRTPERAETRKLLLLQ